MRCNILCACFCCQKYLWPVLQFQWAARPIQSLIVGLEQPVIYTCRSFMDAQNTFVSTFSPLCHELSPNPAAAVSAVCLAFLRTGTGRANSSRQEKTTGNGFLRIGVSALGGVFTRRRRLLFLGEPRPWHARLLHGSSRWWCRYKSLLQLHQRIFVREYPHKPAIWSQIAFWLPLSCCSVEELDKWEQESGWGGKALTVWKLKATTRFIAVNIVSVQKRRRGRRGRRRRRRRKYEKGRNTVINWS